jgi:hypothetical protein
MPGGFQGSVVVNAAGLVVGVSNNVNYDVKPFDGSAAYNMPVAATTLLTFSQLANTPNDGFADGTLTVNLPVPFSVPVLLEIIETTGNVSFTDPGNTDVVAAFTDAFGVLTRNVFLLAAPPATFDVNVYYDVNSNGILDVGDVLMATGTFTIS